MTRSEQSETLVIGATGKTGRRVARRLTALGAPVRPGSRKAPRPFDWEDPGTAGAGGHLGRVRRLLPGPGHARVGAGPPLLSGPSTACCSSATRTTSPDRSKRPAAASAWAAEQEAPGVSRVSPSPACAVRLGRARAAPTPSGSRSSNSARGTPSARETTTAPSRSRPATSPSTAATPAAGTASTTIPAFEAAAALSVVPRTPCEALRASTCSRLRAVTHTSPGSIPRPAPRPTSASLTAPAPGNATFSWALPVLSTDRFTPGSYPEGA